MITASFSIPRSLLTLNELTDSCAVLYITGNVDGEYCVAHTDQLQVLSCESLDGACRRASAGTYLIPSSAHVCMLCERNNELTGVAC